jgi:VWFA-related protein
MKQAGWRCPQGLAGIVWIAWAAAQAPAMAAQQASPEPVVGEAVDVRVVNIEVLALDRRSRPVAGLKPADFRLKVDGNPVPIEYFTEVKDGRAVEAAGKTGDGAQPAAQPGLQAGAAIGTRYLVFVDDLFPLKGKRDDLLAAMKKDLDRVGPEDSMMIVSWEGGRLVQLAGWTSSHQDLAKALDVAMARPSHGLEQQLRLAGLLEESRLVVGSDGGVTWGDNSTVDEVLDNVIGPTPGLALSEFAYSRTLARQVGNASLAVMSAMRGAGTPPGRKMLLLLAGGWPFSVESFVRAGQPAGLASELPDSQITLHALTATANLLGYTIYPLDVPGLTSVLGDIRDNPLGGQSSSGRRIENHQRAQTPTSMSIDPPQTAPPPSFARPHGSAREQEIQATLLFLARETGGRPLLNGNRKLGLATADEDTHAYYWLGFTPAWQRNGRAHRIEVEVLRKDVETRARRSFIDLSPVQTAMMTVESALLFGELPDAEPLTIRLGQPVKGKNPRVTEIPVTLDIPASAVTLLPADGRYSGQAELRLAAMDEKGNQSNVPTVALRLVSPRQPSAGAKLRYETRISLRGRTSRLVATVYDPLTGKMAAGQVSVLTP